MPEDSLVSTVALRGVTFVNDGVSKLQVSKLGPSNLSHGPEKSAMPADLHVELLTSSSDRAFEFPLHSNVLKFLGVEMPPESVFKLFPTSSLHAFLYLLYGGYPQTETRQQVVVGSTWMHVMFLLTETINPLAEGMHEVLYFLSSKWARILETVVPDEALVALVEDLFQKCNASALMVDVLAHRMRRCPEILLGQTDLCIKLMAINPINFLRLHRNVSSNDLIAPSPLCNPEPRTPMTLALERESSRLKWKPLDSERATCLADSFNSFRFSIVSNGVEYYLAVFPEILYCRWPYFTKMMDSGLVESVEMHCRIPSHFSMEGILAVIRAHYEGNAEEHYSRLGVDAGRFLLENAEELYLRPPFNVIASELNGFQKPRQYPSCMVADTSHHFQ
jgi:hypothetical protein